MWEAIADIAKLSFLRVLFDGIQGIFFGYLLIEPLFLSGHSKASSPITFQAHLHFGICPPGYLYNHVQYCLLLIGVQWDVVKGRNRVSFLLNVDTVI